MLKVPHPYPLPQDRNSVRSSGEAVDAVYSLFGDERKEQDSAAKTRVPFLKVRGPLQVCRRMRRSLLEGALEDAGPGAEGPQLRKADGEPALWWGQRLGEADSVENTDRTKPQGESGCAGGKTMEGKRPDGEGRSTEKHRNESEREDS